MFLILYDIQDDRLRTKFAQFLSKHGRRIQYSVFEITNSQRLLSNVKITIKEKFARRFGLGDSVLIYDVGDNSCIQRYGYPVNEENDLVIS